MSGEFGATGIDPDWYDNGPGSENYKRKMAKEHHEYQEEVWRERRAEADRVAGLDAEIARLTADAERIQVQASHWKTKVDALKARVVELEDENNRLAAQVIAMERE